MTSGREGVPLEPNLPPQWAPLKAAVETIFAGKAEAVTVPIVEGVDFVVKRHPLEDRVFLMETEWEGIQAITTIFPASDVRPGAYPGFVPFLPGAWTCYFDVVGDDGFSIAWSDVSSDHRQVLLDFLDRGGWQPLLPFPDELIMPNVDEQLAFQLEQSVRVVSSVTSAEDPTLTLLHFDLA